MPPLLPKPDTCAVIVRDEWGRYDGNCERTPTHRARWRFEVHTARVLFCDEHAAELSGDQRLTPMP